MEDEHFFARGIKSQCADNQDYWDLGKADDKEANSWQQQQGVGVTI